MAIAIDGIRNLFTQVIAYDHRILCHTVDDPTGALGIEEVGMVVMADAHNHPVAWLQGLAHSWPQVGVEVTGRHTA